MRTVSSSPTLATSESTIPGDHKMRRTEFFGRDDSYEGRPQAALWEFWRSDPSKVEPDELVPPHFHDVRQFLVFTDSEKPSVNGEHVRIPQFSFQFTDPSTPYGPVMVDGAYMAFFALRARPDIAGHRLDTSADKLRAAPGRRIVVPHPLTPGKPGAESLLDEAADGLAAYRVTLGIGERGAGPDGSAGDGQFYVVMEGSLSVDGELLPPLSLGWVEPNEGAVPLLAGPEGVSMLVLQFPQPDQSIETTEGDGGQT